MATIASRTDRLFIVWKRECFRSTQTAHIFNCEVAFIYPIKSPNIFMTGIRYFLSGLLTVLKLGKEQPRLLIVLNQPLLLVVIGMLYAKLFRAKYILDNHSRIFDSTNSRFFQFVYALLLKNVDLNISHNEKDSATVKQWGGENIILETIPFITPVEPVVAKNVLRPYVLCVCSFAADEPIEVILLAAQKIPEIQIFITGNFLKRGFSADNVPKNVNLTGFLCTQAYYDKFINASAIVSLSTRPWIMQMAVEEALVMGKPIVTNPSPVLESVLGDAGIFSSIDPVSIADGISTAYSNSNEYSNRMLSARDRLKSVMRARLQRPGVHQYL